jgi:hypothetical protein
MRRRALGAVLMLPCLTFAQATPTPVLPVHITAIVAFATTLVLMAVWGYLQLQAAYGLLNSERRALEQAEKLRRESGDEPFLNELVRTVGSSTKVQHACEATRSAAKLGASLAQVGDYAEEARLAIESRSLATRNIAQMAIYIGLLGTLVGLAVAVQQLNSIPVIRGPQDLRTFGEATRAMFGSFGLAFVSAGVGILVTVGLSVLVSKFDFKTAEFQRNLERFLLTAVAPAAKAFVERNRPLTEIGLMEKLVKDLDEVLTRSLQGFRDAGTSASDAAKAFETAAVKSTEAVGTLDDAAVQVSTAARTMQLVSAESGKHREELVSSIAGIRNALIEIQELMERLEALTAGWETHIPVLSESTAQLRRTNELAAQIMPGFRTALGEANDRAKRDLVDFFGLIVTHLEQTRKVLDSQAGYLNDVAYLVREVPGAVKEGMDQMVVNVPEPNVRVDLGSLSGQLHEIASSIATGVQRIESAVQGSRPVPGGAPTGDPIPIQNVEAGLSTLSRQLDLIRQELQIGRSPVADPEVIRLLGGIQSELARLSRRKRGIWPFGGGG